MTYSKFFRAAEWTFTWSIGRDRALKVEMWREDPDGKLHWVTAARSRSGDRNKAHALALAMIAWVRSLEVRTGNDTKSRAIAERIACIADRGARLDETRALCLRLAVTRFFAGEAAAA